MMFNEKLVELRKKEGLSQEELGHRLNVTRQTISKWELGQTKPEMDKLSEMSKIFNVSVDELLNETESTPTLKKTIEDEPINNKKNTNNSKIIIIIIALLIIVLIWIVVKIVTGFSTLNKNITDSQEGVFDKFFGMLNTAIETQENIMGGNEGLTNDVQNMFGDVFNQMNSISNNATLELYKGSNRGNQLKKLIDEIITTNKTKDKKITVKYIGIETQNTDEISNIKTSIKDNGNYEVSFEYDEQGYIYEVNIERFFSEFEKTGFNNSFEIYSGSNKGALLISVLDKIITSNKTEDRIITVKYMENETQNEEEIRNIKRSIDNFADYELIYEYDEDGFINKATIEKI